ncbi:MAG TPA: membrane protein insertion efficiency factor YidD [Candidatus Binatia bacterium]|nr:membrane protein insertion efficiency factor YidD [Candidatus Binatia bacterium]
MPSPSLPALGLLGLIQLYKWTLSPLIGRGCRYQPTCSSYTADAIRAHGAWAGSWMGAARICRCAPWGGHGWDPAPETVRKNSWWRPWRYGDWKGARSETFSLAEKVASVSEPDEGRRATRAVAGSAGGAAEERPSPPSPSPQGRGGDSSARVES